MINAKSIKKVFSFLLTLAVILSCVDADAKVYIRWKTSDNVDKVLVDDGGKKVYSSSIKLNEGAAQLSVYNYDRDIKSSMAELAELFKEGQINYGSGNMGIITLNGTKLITRLLVLQLGIRDQTVVVKIEQTAEELRKSAPPPSKNMITGIPEYPGIRHLFYAKNEDTDMCIQVSESQSGPEFIKEHYSSAMKDNGWKQLFENSSSAGIFIKNNEICLLAVATDGRSNNNQITLLHKKYGMK